MVRPSDEQFTAVLIDVLDDFPEASSAADHLRAGKHANLHDIAKETGVPIADLIAAFQRAVFEKYGNVLVPRSAH